ncbi:MAG: TonB family protein [Pyrinomonadaceae bacterium]
MTLRHLKNFFLVFVTGIGVVRGEECTLRVGAFEAKEGGVLAMSEKPPSDVALSGFEASALNKATQKLYPSLDIDGLRYFSGLPEGAYRLILTKPGFKTLHYRYDFDCGVEPWSVLTWSVQMSRGLVREIDDRDPKNELRRLTKLGSSDSSYPVSVSGGQAIYLPSPKLSIRASGLDFKGVVKIRVFVNAKGEVVSTNAVSGHPLLLADCETAAYYSRFSPRMEDGRAVSFYSSIEYPFGLTHTPPKPTPKMVSRGVLNGKALSLPKPIFPPEARAIGASGAVSVQTVVDEMGNVISATAISGHLSLRPAAEAAARQAKFAPFILEGQSVKVSGVITYNFVP